MENDEKKINPGEEETEDSAGASAAEEVSEESTASVASVAGASGVCFLGAKTPAHATRLTMTATATAPTTTPTATGRTMPRPCRLPLRCCGCACRAIVRLPCEPSMFPTVYRSCAPHQAGPAKMPSLQTTRGMLVPRILTKEELCASTFSIPAAPSA